MANADQTYISPGNTGSNNRMFTAQQDKWLQRVTEVFMRYGIKSITMDDVARELGISKKTLYAFVESKDDLVNKMLERHIDMERQMCDVMIGKAGNAIEEMFLVIEANAQQMQQMKANIVHDLQKYHREAWEKVSQFQRQFLYGVVKANLERGVQEGLYRADFDIDILARLHIATTFILFDESVFPQNTYKKEVIFLQYLMHYLHGIASEKGLQLIKEKLEQHAP